MTIIHASPIPALIDYYQRLAADPNEDVAPLGFSLQKISFRVVIEPDGQLHAIQDAREQVEARRVPTSMIVPGQSKPSGQGINPCFLWDNAQYMLGVKADDPKPERTASAFAAFKQHHLDVADQIDDEHFAAVCRFLGQWDPARVSEVEGHELLAELGGGFGVFQLRGQPGYVHQRSAVRDYWNRQCDATATDDDQPTGQSLVSGRTAAIARLHEPKIKGVVGGQSSGGVLVGFNEDAYTSFGKAQSFNAPVAEDEAFEYCTALNRLLSSSAHRVRIGDATAIFWSDRKNKFEHVAAAIFGAEIGENQEAEHAGTTQQVRSFLDALRRGVAHEGVDDPNAPFYVLGLSPNAARISVRFWLAGTVREFADRLAAHIEALELVGARDERPLTIRRLLLETAREPRDIPPQLAGEVSRAVLSGGPYPQSLLTAVLRRVRADAAVPHPRAAIIKACLVRNYEKEIPVALNPEESSAAYQCGRLLALLEYTQIQSIGNVNAGVTRKFYGAASSTPAAVFGKLIANFTKAHLPKLPEGLRQFVDREAKQIFGMLEPAIPKLFAPDEQATFAIGYYHEKVELRETPPDFGHTTERGDRVISKSEVVIANMLHGRGIDYEYERPFPVPGRRPLRPDFTVLGETKRDTVLIEHLGRLDDESYRAKWESKLTSYQAAGLGVYPEKGGPNGLLVSFQEKDGRGLNTQEIAQILDELFFAQNGENNSTSEETP